MVKLHVYYSKQHWEKVSLYSHLERDKNRVIYTLGIKIFNSASTRIHTKFKTYAIHDVQKVASVPCQSL